MHPLAHLRRAPRSYLSRRFWILAALFVALCALAVVQYDWINQLAQAERQRAKANLSAALDNVESDFDVEITRAFMLFESPAGRRADYSQRYRDWLRHAPYPRLIRGVYVIQNPGSPAAPPTPVLAGEPPISPAEWKRARSRPGLPSEAAPDSLRIFHASAGFQMATARGRTVAFESFRPEIVVAGNPAFLFPVLTPSLARPLPKFAGGPRVIARFQGRRIFTAAGPVGPSAWLLVVFDARYIRSTFLPTLVKRYLPASVYQVQVVGSASQTPPRVLFSSQPSPARAPFAHPDGKIGLFQFRPDCLSPPSVQETVKVVGIAPAVAAFSSSTVAQILSRRPASCTGPAPAIERASAAPWRMLVRYRAGSLDQAMASFRDRNLLLGGSVLVVLALGIAMLVVLTERARALAEMQAEFALGVSHELRTPLTVIRLAADNLEKGIVENSAQARHYGEIIHAHAAELTHMIEDTLEFARLHSPSLLRHAVLVPPGEIVRAALADAEPSLREAGIEFELHLAPDLPCIEADPGLLKRCLANLIQNVVKYAAAGRWMAIRADKTPRPEGECVRISIEDRGPGIAPLDRRHVFEPFYRGKFRRPAQTPGVGLGLTLVKRVVEAHHGSVEIETSETAGTRFSIFLPPRRQRPAPSPESRPES